MSEAAPQQNKALQNGGGTSIGIGAGVGGATGSILAWMVGLFGIDMPPEVAAAFGTILTVLLQLTAAHYYTDS